jgi:hypothetical protein
MFSLTDAQTERLYLLLVMVGGFISLLVKDYRNRKWAKKDRDDEFEARRKEREQEKQEIIDIAEAKAEALLIASKAAAEAIRIEAAVIAERLSIEQRKTASLIREDQRKTADCLQQELEQVKAVALETKAVAGEAFHEANHTKTDIARLYKQLVHQGVVIEDVAQASVEKAGQLKVAVNENTDRLGDIQDTVTRIDDKDGKGAA